MHVFSIPCLSLTELYNECFLHNCIFVVLSLAEINNDDFLHGDAGVCVAAKSSKQTHVVTALAVACMLLSFLVTLKWSLVAALWRWGTVISRKDNTQSRLCYCLLQMKQQYDS